MKSKTGALALVLYLMLMLAGCMGPDAPNQRDGALTGETVRPFEEDRMQEELEDAGDAIRRGAKDAGDAVRRGAEDVGDALMGEDRREDHP